MWVEGGAQPFSPLHHHLHKDLALDVQSKFTCNSHIWEQLEWRNISITTVKEPLAIDIHSKKSGLGLKIVRTLLKKPECGGEMSNTHCVISFFPNSENAEHCTIVTESKSVTLWEEGLERDGKDRLQRSRGWQKSSLSWLWRQVGNMRKHPSVFNIIHLICVFQRPGSWICE